MRRGEKKVRWAGLWDVAGNGACDGDGDGDIGCL